MGSLSTLLEHEGVDGDRRALSGPVTIVEVVEASAQALVEDVGAAQGKRTIAADRESSREESTGLGRGVELKLVVGGDVSSASFGVLEDTVGEGKLEGRVAGAGNHDGSPRRAGTRRGW